MRLINCVTGCMEEFVGSKIPDYAILSHTREEDEITYFEPGGWNDWPAARKGYWKIQLTCRLARERHLKYAWVDTCCIDKKSSAELSEAIKTMHKWYERAAVCFVCLSDLDDGESLETTLPTCRWFGRVWTLQELIAPKDVLFFDNTGAFRGSKADLVDTLSRATTISPEILLHQRPLRSVAVAEKSAWAAHRSTTRIEDIAYSLLGIFDINMSLLYGEERKAFRRLQEEIIRTTPDTSIFAWRSPVPSKKQSPKSLYSGLLADSPRAFARDRPIIKRPYHPRVDMAVTSIGIKISIRLVWHHLPPSRQVAKYVLPLDCGDARGNFYGIVRRKCGPSEFLRKSPNLLLENPDEMRDRSSRVIERYLLTKLPDCDCCPDRSPRAFSIGHLRSHALQISMPENIRIAGAWPVGSFDNHDRVFFLINTSNMHMAALEIESVPTDVAAPGAASFSCVFYAVGWSGDGAESLPCTIIDRSKFPTIVDHIEHLFSTSNPQSIDVRAILHQYRIPICSSVRLWEGHSATLSFRASLVENQALCRNALWRVEFHLEEGRALKSLYGPGTSQEKTGLPSRPPNYADP